MTQGTQPNRRVGETGDRWAITLRRGHNRTARSRAEGRGGTRGHPQKSAHPIAALDRGVRLTRPDGGGSPLRCVRPRAQCDSDSSKSRPAHPAAGNHIPRGGAANGRLHGWLLMDSHPDRDPVRSDATNRTAAPRARPANSYIQRRNRRTLFAGRMARRRRRSSRSDVADARSCGDRILATAAYLRLI
jgi:hypothetical protein